MYFSAKFDDNVTIRRSGSFSQELVQVFSAPVGLFLQNITREIAARMYVRHFPAGLFVLIRDCTSRCEANDISARQVICYSALELAD